MQKVQRSACCLVYEIIYHLGSCHTPAAAGSYSTAAALDLKITEILRVVAEIQNHSKPVIEHCYREFLLQNHDPDEREYPDAADQIREVLIHDNYLSQNDIETCLGFDVESLADRPSIEGMRELHAALVEKYKVEDANSAA